jgi:hypothetical protein
LQGKIEKTDKRWMGKEKKGEKSARELAKEIRQSEGDMRQSVKRMGQALQHAAWHVMGWS